MTTTQLIKHYSMAQVDELLRQGRITDDQHADFEAAWEWSNVRMGGQAGRRQDAYYNAHGREAYHAKINETRAALGLQPLF